MKKIVFGVFCSIICLNSCSSGNSPSVQTTPNPQKKIVEVPKTNSSENSSGSKEINPSAEIKIGTKIDNNFLKDYQAPVKKGTKFVYGTRIDESSQTPVIWNETTSEIIDIQDDIVTKRIITSDQKITETKISLKELTETSETINPENKMDFFYEGTEEVKVPGGTFNATKLSYQVESEIQSSSGVYRKSKFTAYMWFVKGLGYVKHDTYALNGGWKITTQLLEYKIP